MTSTAAITIDGVRAELPLPGGSIGVRVKVYDTVAPDGKISGTPHVHLLCSEMYLVLAGTGGVELIDSTGFRSIDLKPFDSLVFTPGTIHRLLNPNRNLELLVIEQGGFPEFGDRVVCLPDEILSDPKLYEEVRTVKTLEDAMRRRSLAVEGFNRLRDAFARSAEAGREMLARFYRRCYERTAQHYPTWETATYERVLAEARQCFRRLDELEQGDTSRLFEARHAMMPGESYNGIGYCGYLHKYGATAPAKR